MKQLLLLLVLFVSASLQNEGEESQPTKKLTASDINCTYAGEIFPSPELMRYFICLAEDESSLVAHLRCCRKQRMFDLITKKCEKIPGGGDLDIVINNSTCGNNYIGFKAHPTRPNKYLKCLSDSVYVFKCVATNAVYDEEYQKCMVDKTTSMKNSAAKTDKSEKNHS